MLSSWNGWMLAAFAEAALAFDNAAYREAVRRNAGFLLTRIDRDGRLLRHAQIPGLLEDYAGVAWGLTLAYEAVHERRFLDAARSLTQQMLARFRDETFGGFFDTPDDHETLIARPQDLFDNATPAASSVACEVLLRHAILFGEASYVDLATRAIEAAWPLAERYPSAFGFLLGAAEWRSGMPKEIAITGEGETFELLRHTAGAEFLPHRVLVAGSGSADLPLMQHRPHDRALAYVCEGYACLEPTADPARLRELLGIG
jgi:uncharacterized protein YyaL (SSP411 family)